MKNDNRFGSADPTTTDPDPVTMDSDPTTMDQATTDPMTMDRESLLGIQQQWIWIQ